MGRELQMIDTEFSTELLDRFIFAVEGRMKTLYVVKKFMTSEKAMEYLDGMCESTFYKLIRNGEIKQFFFKDCSIPYYCPLQMANRLEENANIGYKHKKKRAAVKI